MKSITESILNESADAKKAVQIIQSGEFSYDCLEGILSITSDDGQSFDIDLRKITPDMMKKIIA